jgi:hypothetical protein
MIHLLDFIRTSTNQNQKFSKGKQVFANANVICMYQPRQRVRSIKIIPFCVFCFFCVFVIFFVNGIYSNFKNNQKIWQNSWTYKTEPSLWLGFLKTTEQLVESVAKVIGKCMNTFLNQLNILNKFCVLIYFMYFFGIAFFSFFFYKLFKLF